MQILLATHNEAKLQRYRCLLRFLQPDMEIKSLTDLAISDKFIEADQNYQQIALEKAKFYAKISGLITLASDESLTTNFLPDNMQPQAMVRRYGGHGELTDEQVLVTWHKIFNEYNTTSKIFYWNYAFAYYNPLTDDSGLSLCQKESYVQEDFSQVVRKGYPMDSFMTYKGTDKYASLLTDEERLQNDKITFAGFIDDFKKWLKKQ